MKSLASGIKDILLNRGNLNFTYRLTLYKKWGGHAENYIGSAGSCIYYVIGDATKWFSLNDLCIITDSHGLDENEITAISYHTNGVSDTNLKTTAITLNSPYLGGIDSLLGGGYGKRFIYEKNILSNDLIIEDSLGGINTSLDFPNLNEFDSGNFDIILNNKDNILWDESAKTGLLYNGAIKTTISSIGTDTITIAYTPQLGTDILTGHTLNILSGSGYGRSYIISANSYSGGNILTLAVHNFTGHGLATGDELVIDIKSELFAKLELGVLGHTGSANILLFFGGVIYPENIEYILLKNQVKINCLGFLSLLDKQYGYNLGESSEANKHLYTLSGLTPLNYYRNELTLDKYGKRIIKLEQKESRVTGFTPTASNSVLKKGWHRIYFSPPYLFKLDNGDWTGTSMGLNETEKNDDPTPDGTRIYLEDEFGGFLYGNFKRADYPPKSELAHIYVGDIRSGDSDIQNNTLYLKLDDGDPVILYDRVHKLVRDDSFVEGEYVTGTTVLSTEYPIAIFNGSASPVALYIGLSRITDSFIISPIGNTHDLSDHWAWYYSKHGEGSDGWAALTITDDTDGFTKEGSVSFNIPEDWSLKARIGTGDQSGLYWVRIVIQSGGGSPDVDVWKLNPNIACKSELGDIISFSANLTELPKEAAEDSILVGRNMTGDPILRTNFCGRPMYSIIGLLTREAGFYYSSDVPSGYLTGDRDIRVLCNFPKKFINSKRISLVQVSSRGWIFIALDNEIWRFNKQSGFERVLSIDSNYYITNIKLSSSGTYIIGCAILRLQDLAPPPELTSQYPPCIYFVIDNPESIPILKYIVKVDSGKDVDTRFVFRSGIRYEVTISMFTHQYYTVGYRKANFQGDLKRILQENVVNVTPLKLILSDIEETYSTVFTAEENSIWGLANYTENTGALPFAFGPLSFGNAYWHFLEGEIEEPVNKDCGVRSTFNTKGLLLPSWENELKAIVLAGNPTSSPNYRRELKIRDLSSATAAYDSFILQHFLGLPDQIGGGEIDAALTQNSEANQHIKGHILHGLSGRSAKKEHWLLSFQDRDTEIVDYTTDPADIKDLMQYGWITKVIEYQAGGSSYGIKPYKIYHFDESAATFTDVTDSTSLDIDDLDVLYLYGGLRFGNLYMSYSIVSGAPTLEYYLATGTSTYTQFTPEVDDLNSAGEGWVKFNLRPHWKRQDDSNISATDQWIFGIRVVDGKINIDPSTLRLYLHQYWGSEEISDTGRTWLTPLECCVDSTGYILWIALLERQGDDVVFRLGCMNSNEDDDTLFNGYQDHMYLASSFPGEFDYNMQIENLVYANATDGIFFTQTDQIYKEKTAKLFKAKFTAGAIAITYIGVMQEGCWGCSDLVYDTDTDTIHGVCFNDTDYFYFEYGDEFYTRVNELDYGDKSLREVLNELCEINSWTATATHDRHLIVKDKFTSPSNIVLWNTKDHIVNIDEIKLFDHQYDAVLGKTKTGNVLLGFQYNQEKILEVNFGDTLPRSAVKLALKNMFKEYGVRRRIIEISGGLLLYHELMDFIELSIPLRFGSYDPNLSFMISSIDFNLKKGQTKATLLEVL